MPKRLAALAVLIVILIYAAFHSERSTAVPNAYEIAVLRDYVIAGDAIQFGRGAGGDRPLAPCTEAIATLARDRSPDDKLTDPTFKNFLGATHNNGSWDLRVRDASQICTRYAGLVKMSAAAAEVHRTAERMNLLRFARPHEIPPTQLAVDRVTAEDCITAVDGALASGASKDMELLVRDQGLTLPRARAVVCEAFRTMVRTLEGR